MSKVTSFYCDGCRCSENELPREWISLKEAKETSHFCCVGCLIKFLSEKKNIEVKAPDGHVDESIA